MQDLLKDILNVLEKLDISKNLRQEFAMEKKNLEDMAELNNKLNHVIRRLQKSSATNDRQELEKTLIDLHFLWLKAVWHFDQLDELTRKILVEVSSVHIDD
jgi:ribosome-associated toxin RatA of RatAB toxin-antitoxin module